MLKYDRMGVIVFMGKDFNCFLSANPWIRFTVSRLAGRRWKVCRVMREFKDIADPIENGFVIFKKNGRFQ